jgi:hypothetical protein
MDQIKRPGTCVAFVLVIAITGLGGQDRLDSAIQGAGIFVALLAAVVALHAADPKPKSLAVNIETSIDQDHTESYDKVVLRGKIPLDAYEHLPDCFISHRVVFRITNVSGFTLRQPTLTFRLPTCKQHPHKLSAGSDRWVRTFRSNLFNTQSDLKAIDFGDTSVLSNSNLPFWNDREEITIWIRMVLGAGDLSLFEVSISVNSENAEGVTTKMVIPLLEELTSVADGNEPSRS